MKLNRQLYILTVTLFAFLFVSCSNNDDDFDPVHDYVNNWIYEIMDAWYYWDDKMPANPDTTKDPESFFKSLLYTYNKQTNPEGDRFSWIQKNYVDLLNALNGVTPTDVGFEYLAAYRKNSNAIDYWVCYVKPNTDAYAKGLRRGDKISTVDGVAITKDNYASLLRAGKSEYELKVLNPATDETRTIIVTVEQNYAENPVYYSNTYDVDGKKIGYLMYNFFAVDKGDNRGAYDIALNNVLTEFYNDNITDLVLDLRYNTGGIITSTVRLASALVPDRSTEKKFNIKKYNPTVTAYYQEKEGDKFFYDSFVDNFTISNTTYNIPRLGDKIGKLYILTSANTASASELIINGLRPYMDVFLIGDVTYGKNVGSITFYEENKSYNKWGLQPIVVRTYNANNESDYNTGFEPDVAIDEILNALDNDDMLYPIGDKDNEIMLKMAIDIITGNNAYTTTVKSSRLDSSLKKGSSLEQKPGAFQMVFETPELQLNK
ncbi:S41 family peptidase [Dysgonomonas sp. 216]|uniref:S41 family peptidase n=1 Tax=Dysgonomonas sp. 216 TaxID=2302934 RepID=UPI0013D16762|nr:S41 family peptidase [Dysgonomonas sp. 216]